MSRETFMVASMTGESRPNHELDLEHHEAEDGTAYWSFLHGGLVLHIVMDGGRFVATDMLGQQLGEGASPREAATRALMGLINRF